MKSSPYEIQQRLLKSYEAANNLAIEQATTYSAAGFRIIGEFRTTGPYVTYILSQWSNGQDTKLVEPSKLSWPKIENWSY